MNKSGIYKITNLVNNKIYIGSAVNLRKRHNSHFYDLRNNKHHSIHLQRAYNRDKEENFKWEVIEEVEFNEDKQILKENLLKREQYWLDYYEPYNPEKGYNIFPVAGSRMGMNHSKETKNKLSTLHKGKILSEEHKRKIKSNHRGMSGRKHSEETKNIMKEKALERETSFKKGHVLTGCRRVINISTGIVFNSIKEASKFYNIHRTCISSACSGIQKTAGGFIWKYES